MAAVTIDFPDIKGYADLLRQYPDQIRRASVLAANDTARYALKVARKALEDQLNFPPGYLDESRLFIARYAAANEVNAVEAQVAGRGRATSLARFIIGNRTPSEFYGAKRAPPIAIRVKGIGGNSLNLARAFLVNLKSNNDPGGAKDNIGLAVRLRPGEMLERSQKAKLIFPNVYLLYGPSVAQALLGADGVRGIWPDVKQDVADYLAVEFKRQIAVQLNGG